MAERRPRIGLPSVDGIQDPATREYLNSLKEIIEEWDGQRGDSEDQVLTRRDLGNPAILRTVRGPLADAVREGNQSGGAGGGGDGGGVGLPDLEQPPIPTGFAVSGAIEIMLMQWDDPLDVYNNHSHTEIWRAQVDDFGEAVRVATTPSFIHADTVGTDSTNYYWIRFVNTQNVRGPFNSIQGTSGTTGKVEGPDLAANSVTTNTIRAGSITAASAILANLAVVSAKIAEGAVTNLKIGDIIESSNFVSGVRGWRLNKQGNLEISDGTFRGLLQGANGNFSGTLTAQAINAVDTINVRGNAITVPASSYRPGLINVPASVWTEAVSLNFNAEPGPITIFTNFFFKNWDAVASNKDGSVSAHFRLRRNTLVIYQHQVFAVGGHASLNFRDDPPNGVHGYSVEVFFTGTHTRTAEKRFLFLIQTKR